MSNFYRSKYFSKIKLEKIKFQQEFVFFKNITTLKSTCMGYVKHRINIEQPLSSGVVHKTPQSEFEGYCSTAAVYF